MGLTIHYEGSVSSFENIRKILKQVKMYSIENKWKIETEGRNDIVVTPHPQCESLSFTFNDNLSFSGFTKTGFAPIEVHELVIKLFFEIKPLFKKLKIDDESGYWHAYLDSRRNMSLRTEKQFAYQEDDTDYLEHFTLDPSLLSLYTEVVKNRNIKLVLIEESPVEDNSVYWAYWCNTEKKFQFVFKNKITLQYCSGDFFEYNIVTGKGKVLPVKVTELPMTSVELVEYLRTNGFSVRTKSE